MQSFKDATGYLIELRDSVNESWFNAVCDMALNSTGQHSSPQQLQELWDYLHNFSSYKATAATVIPLDTSSKTIHPPLFVDALYNFDGFKKLSPNLNIQFNKQISIIFGKNGSGKSSICQAFRVLANPEKPNEPLYNAHEIAHERSCFSYRFKDANNSEVWNSAKGYGTHSQDFKYFDSSIALSNVTNAMNAETAVEISVYRLEIFEYARILLTDFQTDTSRKIKKERDQLCDSMEQFISELQKDTSIELDLTSKFTPEDSSLINDWLEFPRFDETINKRLDLLPAKIEQLTSAATDNGLKTLRAQFTLLEQLRTNVSTFNNECMAAPLSSLQEMESLLSHKRAAQQELSKNVFPNESNSRQFNEFINAASKLIDFELIKANVTECPLCRQSISEKAELLFGEYHKYLGSKIQQDVETLSRSIAIGKSHLNKIRDFALNDITSCQENLPQGFPKNLKGTILIIQHSLPKEEAPIATGDKEKFTHSHKLTEYIRIIEETISEISEAITRGTNNKSGLSLEIENLQEENKRLRLHKAISLKLTELTALKKRVAQFELLKERVNHIDFATLFRHLTIKAKAAHTELVLGSFEERLSEEYEILCGMTLEQMGIRLASKGRQQDIIVTPQVGNSPIHRVLSEGEQKIHALAVFMCEVTISPSQILVFDDPATSFDYNYISNFCERLRSFALDHPQTQIIILTHNWDFFVNIQSCMKRLPSLINSLSVQVLEDCSTLSEYCEEWDRLCTTIDAIINTPTAIDSQEKESLAGFMRRLIESLTNTFVFNKQRHQYKIKSLRVSNFTDYTKLVPLLPQEAEDLGRLYSYLSPPEHDDVRNYYSTKDKLQFVSWYSEIKRIQTAVEARRALIV